MKIGMTQFTCPHYIWRNVQTLEAEQPKYSNDSIPKGKRAVQLQSVADIRM